ncbi:MAG: L,D-transpeptidase [Verrucomicrobiales bacterium]
MKTEPPTSRTCGATIVGAMVLLCMLPSCRSTTSKTDSPTTGEAGKPMVVGGIEMRMLFDWNGTDVKGPISVRINRKEQMALFYKGGQEVGWSYVATGVQGHRTLGGSFRIQEKKQDKDSNIWGRVEDAAGETVVSDARNGRDKVPSGGRFVGARMPYWMRLTSEGIGMHKGPIPNPGSPASHGCIRLPGGMAEILFSEVSIGTPVTIE